jgi:hypothetical protein
MKATTLRRRYPKQWANIEKAMLNDFNLCRLKKTITTNSTFPVDSNIDMQAIAYNAAFLGCYEMHKTIRELKNN